MKIFIVGMPQSGRTTVAKAICQAEKHCYIDAQSWVKSLFREKKDDERAEHYDDEYHNWFVNRLKFNPSLITDILKENINAYGSEDEFTFVIDGLESPKDLITMFDYNKDIIVFLNRINNESEFKDHQSIGLSVMRDFCFWFASADRLPRERGIEYNFTLPGDDSTSVKSLGQKNSVYIARSFNRVISHLKELISS